MTGKNRHKQVTVPAYAKEELIRYRDNKKQEILNDMVKNPRKYLDDLDTIENE